MLTSVMFFVGLALGIVMGALIALPSKKDLETLLQHADAQKEKAPGNGSRTR
jgi:hypothetical protein